MALRRKNHQDGSPGGTSSIALSVLACLLLSMSTVLLLLLAFLYALSKVEALPGLGPISGDTFTAFLGSWLILVLGGALALISFLLLVLANTGRVRRIFAGTGISALLAAAFGFAAAVPGTGLPGMLPGEWQDVFTEAAAVFRDFCLLGAILLTVVGATCLSIYFCIAVIKGGRHEQVA